MRALERLCIKILDEKEVLAWIMDALETPEVEDFLNLCVPGEEKSFLSYIGWWLVKVLIQVKTTEMDSIMQNWVTSDLDT